MNSSRKIYRILLVEDEVMMQKFLQKFIYWEQLGYEICATASNGKQALELIPEKQPDIILTDIQMPVMDGLELAHTVHRMYPQIKVILISAYSDFSYARKGIECGIYNYILKSDEESSIANYFVRLHRMLSQPNEDPCPPQPNSASQTHSRVVDECLNYIEQNYASDISLKDLSEYTHTHTNHICRLFSQELGCSFNDILTLKRLEASKILLKNTNMKIYEIAELVGYHKPAYYSELFKKYYRKTPNEFRNEN